ncbi:biotin-dependent carboxyltransferase family protein [Halobacillus fulvus]|nr:biotin-dependent carboxyltransferase family protein [Halobacillus fulvus]
MIHIQKAGLLTTVQDLGRFGFKKHGVVTSGAMDQEAHLISNWLVGNNPNTPTLEITLMGPVIEFQEDALIAICGGNLSPLIEGDAVECWKPIFVRKGTELRFGRPASGFRAYLAIGGGFNIPSIMDSASTYMRAQIGGYEGRPLEDGDRLSVDRKSPSSESLFNVLKEKADRKNFHASNWSVSEELRSRNNDPIRVIKGREFDQFTDVSQDAFTNEPFTIDSKSDRMGYRLNGQKLKWESDSEMISSAVSIGTIQVPSDGNPILLLADSQTTGGYPRMAHVITADLPKIAQMKPGEDIHFQIVSHEEAQQLYLQRQNLLRHLELGIRTKTG